MQPAELGRYRIIGVLGRGGMGVVYEGHDPQIDRPVAIKTIALDALSDHERAIFESRFRAEMMSAGRLQHQNIVALYDTGRDGGTAYIVMERVAGHDLKHWLRGGRRFTVDEARAIMLQLLAALEFAHRRNVIHRDVKPANVMLQHDGIVKLCDFGVARLADADATRTQGLVVGSLRYASPEQIAGQPIDARTDIYSAGVLLFELLTGELPFKGQSDVEVLNRIAHETAPAPSSIDPRIPPELDGALARSLDKDPARRFANAAEFALALNGTAANGSLAESTTPRPAVAVPLAPPAPPAPSAPPETPHGAGRVGRGLAIASGALLVAGAGAYFWTRTPPKSDQVPGPVAEVAPALTSPSVPALASTTAPSAASTATPPVSPAVGSATVATRNARSASPVASAPAAAPNVANASTSRPATTEVRIADGAWRGRLRCGPLMNSSGASDENQAFDVMLEVRVQGDRIMLTRGDHRYIEVSIGRIAATGRFEANGHGWYLSQSERRGSWRVKAQGERTKDNRIEATLQHLRWDDSTLARVCTLSAEPGASQPPAPVIAVGLWQGQMACSAVINPRTNSDNNKPFSESVEMAADGSRIAWIRGNASFYESAAGRLRADGHFGVGGEGWYLAAGTWRDPWRAKAEGSVQLRQNRVEAAVQLLRWTDGTLARECSLRAQSW